MEQKGVCYENLNNMYKLYDVHTGETKNGEKGWQNKSGMSNTKQ